MSGKAEAKRKVITLYSQGDDYVDTKLRAVAGYIGVPQQDISDTLSLVHALTQSGTPRLRHSLFIDCLHILGQVREDYKISHKQIADATQTVLGFSVRARPTWLKGRKNIVCFIYGCTPGDLPG